MHFLYKKRPTLQVAQPTTEDFWGAPIIEIKKNHEKHNVLQKYKKKLDFASSTGHTSNIAIRSFNGQKKCQISFSVLVPHFNNDLDKLSP